MNEVLPVHQWRSYWTDEMLGVLMVMAADKKSGSQISDALGVSRSSVLGKASRHGIKLGSPPGPAKRIGQGVRIRSKKQTTPFIGREAETDSPWLTLLDLPPCGCRWPKGDPADLETFRYCGLEAVPDRPYCASHCALAYVPPGTSRPKVAIRHWR